MLTCLLSTMWGQSERTSSRTSGSLKVKNAKPQEAPDKYFQLKLSKQSMIQKLNVATEYIWWGKWEKPCTSFSVSEDDRIQDLAEILKVLPERVYKALSHSLITLSGERRKPTYRHLPSLFSCSSLTPGLSSWGPLIPISTGHIANEAKY